ncbi:MaoC family dehydratase N-terminal domain-containing protein [Micromonospora sp. C31]|uniref:MaoC/PaaZ C-terminal domain-containing protein n=1 Tax=Micromonospora sp. C31 TaxID=2824876 RepID=UPI001B37672D|nr:MaoC family dehydratase N-terminal domain-containing protein [Micromonospora sp. C31]
MARRGQPAPEPDDLSVHELIDGPTEILSQDTLDAIRGPEASGHDLSLEQTHDLSASSVEATQDLSGRGAAGHARERVELPRMPAAGALYRRALLGALPGLGGGRRSAGVPAVELAVGGIAVDRTHLADYDRVCGFRLTDRLPATFPHVMGFPLALRLMTAPEFPIPLTGVVHVGNRITVHRPVTADETLDFHTYAENLRPHDRGRQVDVVLVGSIDGEEVWRGVSTYLGRDGKGGGGGRRDQPGRPTAPAGSARWRVEPRVGTEYARVSGDHNPIHTSRLGARLFGFPRPIAHGMWSKARCLAALENRLPDAYTVEVAFKLPVPLPGTVSFGLLPEGGFALHDPRGRPHLAGLVR